MPALMPVPPGLWKKLVSAVTEPFHLLPAMLPDRSRSTMMSSGLTVASASFRQTALLAAGAHRIDGLTASSHADGGSPCAACTHHGVAAPTGAGGRVAPAGTGRRGQRRSDQDGIRRSIKHEHHLRLCFECRSAPQPGGPVPTPDGSMLQRKSSSRTPEERIWSDTSKTISSKVMVSPGTMGAVVGATRSRRRFAGSRPPRDHRDPCPCR